MLPFNPTVIQSTSPITNVIPVGWVGLFAPGTTIVRYTVNYRYTNNSGVTTAWAQWPLGVGNDLATSTNFDYASLGFGDGIYEFFVQATNNLGQTQPLNPATGTGDTVILDLSDQIQPRSYMPIVSSLMP